MKLKSVKVDKRGAGMSLVAFLADALQISKRRAKSLIDSRSVFVNRRRLWMAKHRLQENDLVEFPREEARAGKRTEHTADIQVVHRDSGLIVVVKPAGILTQGEGSVEEHLRSRFADRGIMAVHRLDRDTSGLLLFTSRPELREKLVALFRERAVRKEYIAIAFGRCDPRRRAIRSAVDGRSAVTHVSVLDSNRQASLLKCRIETGRTHQIRKHLASVGHPVAGDKQYGRKLLADPALRRIPRQMLHAYGIGFSHPETGASIDCISPPPPDFEETARRLGLRLDIKH